jgi:acetyltransferase-like isoleucine patch superfamily enzyme
MNRIETIFDLCSRIKVRLFTLIVARAFKEIGPHTRIAPPFLFRNLHQVSLGEDVWINTNCVLAAIGDRNEPRTKLTIGAHVKLGIGSTIVAAREVVIGEYVLTAPNVYIADQAHNYEDIAIPIVQQGIGSIKPVSIGRHSWLGQNVAILPGVSVGQHCVIGANSVVNRSIPDFSVAVGAPARVVKQLNRKTGKWEKVG